MPAPVTRHPLDDIVWLLCDDNIAAMPAQSQARLLAAACRMLNVATDQLPYAFLMGVLHMSVRLSMNLDRKGDEDWWNPQTTLEFDRIGVVQARAVALATQAATW